MIDKDNKRFEAYKKKLFNIIQSRLPGCKVYLFGSRARGTHKEGADIDLALDFIKQIDFDIILKLYVEIEETSIPLTVDLVDLYTASDTLKKEIQTEGVLWKN